MIVRNYKCKTLDFQNVETGETFPLCDLIDIEKIVVHLETNFRDIYIKRDSHFGVEVFLLKSECLANDISFTTTMFNNGVYFDVRYTKLILSYITDRAREVSHKVSYLEYSYNTLGWLKFQDRDYFLLKDNVINRIHALYEDRTFEFQHGNDELYSHFVKDTILKRPELTLGLGLGLSSTVVSYLKSDLALDNTIVNISGPSSTGKTTIEQFMASLYGNPNMTDKSSLIRTFNGTTNAILAGIGNRHGVPIILDDITASTSRIETGDLIYILANGKGKDRCRIDGQLRSQVANWSGTIFVSSEVPMVEDVKAMNQGILARVISADSILWTESAKQSNDIKAFVSENYGFVGPKFADYILNMDKNILINCYKKCLALVLKMMVRKDNLTERLSKSYASIALTFVIINKCFNYDIDIKAIIQLLIDIEQEGYENRSVSEMALDYVKEFIVSNWSSFADNPQLAFSTTKGTIAHEQGKTIVCIYTEVLRNFLHSKNINEVTTILKKWRKDGIIIADCDKRLSTKSLGARVYKFVFNEYLQATGLPKASESNLTEDEIWEHIEEFKIEDDLPDKPKDTEK